MNTGSKLGPYEITHLLGVGGMGAVYRARDTRLGRDVALKVLPADFVDNADRLRRFEQEAKTLAALNHPNIMTVFDVGQHDGKPYLVSELLEGRTLREELKGGALTTRKATDYALQIAQGLAAAHGKGVIHRDLKPDNLFVTTDGRLKILDFGLAKLLQREGEASAEPKLSGVKAGQGSAGASPSRNVDVEASTLVQPAANSTEPGRVMGTPGYMAPEQVRGELADQRTDIFAFGCVLHEMLSGQRPFKRDMAIATMAAIMNDEPPDLTATKPDLSPALARIAHRCLEKQPERRFQSASDLAFSLESITGSGTANRGTTVAESGVRSLRLKLGFVTLAVVLFGAALIWWRGVQGTNASPVSYRQLTFRRGTIFHARFSPDGRSIFYSAKWGRAPLTVFTTQDQGRTDSSLGLTNADVQAVSRTGDLAVLLNCQYQWWFVNKGTLARMKPGEAPRPLLENVTAADWFPDGTSLAVVRIVGGRWHLEEFPGGKILFETSGYITYPRVSPSGDRVAFMAHQVPFDDRGWVVIADRTGRTNALSGEWSGLQGLAWAPSGKEVWFSGYRDGRYDLHALSVAGRERRLTSMTLSFVLQDIAANGRVLANRSYYPAEVIHGVAAEARERDISWLSVGGLKDYSPDGKTYLFSFTGQGGGTEYTTYLCPTDGSPAVQLGEGSGLALSPDGRWALVMRFNPPRLVLLPTGAGQSKAIELHGIEPSDARLLPDGKRILFAGHEPGRGERFLIAGMDGGKPQPVTPEGVESKRAFRLSPSGTKFIGRNTNQVVVLCFVDGSPPESIPGLGPQDAVAGWCADDQSVFIFRRGDWPVRVYRLEVVTGQKSREPIIELLPADIAGIAETPRVFVAPDGQTYLYEPGRRLSDLFVAEGLK